MRFLVCLLASLSVTYGASLPFRPNCHEVSCTKELKLCPDGTPAPIPAGECCPSLKACKISVNTIEPISNCAGVFCTMDLKICPDGTPAPVPVGECCPSFKACKTAGSLLSGNIPLQSSTTATYNTNSESEQ